ncbi:MAG: pyridoxamine 5'-phosphate oxidase family protein, partial [Actinobacteria bacterium]|nr:pyridoxamine 5'-phosphate oxidase family protein [Actinomycetota bacterium]
MHAAPPRFAPPSASLLTWEWVLDHLAGCRNAWLSTVRPDGRPHAAPLWIVIAGGRLWFSTPRTTTKAKNLRADGRIALHVDSGDVVTIIEGQALPGRA